MKNQKDTVRKMVDHLNNEDADGGFWLPNIQRPFVWSEAQIEKLFDSLMRQYPISTLLVWRTKNGIKHRKFIDNWKGSLRLTDFYVPESEKKKTKKLVLDGQQRLQSLYIGLKGSYEGKELYFDVLSGDLVAPEDIRYRFRFLEADEAKWPWVLFKKVVSSTSVTPLKLAMQLASDAGVTLDEAQRDRVYTNIDRARTEFAVDENIAYQELDSIDEPQAYNENDVVEVFIRANSGGTRLGKSDLLFSLLTSTWDDADLEMEGLLEDLNRTGFAFDRDFVLKACLALLGKGARYDVDKFRDGRTKEQIVEKWQAITEAIQAVKDFLVQRTFIRHDKALPSYLALIPLTYFRYHFPDKWQKAAKLDEYLLRTLVTGVFGGSPDNTIDKCNKLIAERKDFDVSEIFGAILADGRSLDVIPDMVLGQTYWSKEIHLYFNLWYSGFDYQPSFGGNLPQIDHIFPQSLLKKVKDANPNTGKRDVLHYKWQDRDQIANLMLLTAEENGFQNKCDTPPDQWFAQKLKERGDDYLKLHLIPSDPQLWKLENFDKFIDERKKLILQKFTFMLHKGYAGDAPAQQEPPAKEV